ncbi:MAG: SIMPL domain-containing protein [Candidatus Omnitrophota bacterium]|nr:SIMPL domain-containing protein [Candidatus Omnitrophota bacterium]
MLRTAVSVLSAVALFVSPAYALLDTAVDMEQNVITVFASADISVEPDEVRLFYRSMSAPAPTATEALTECRKMSEEAIAALETLGVKADSLSRTGIKILFKQENPMAALMGGYAATQTSRPTGDDADSAEELYAKTSAASLGGKMKTTCVAVEDISVPLPYSRKNDTVLVQDKMMETKLTPIDPNEYGVKGSDVFQPFFGEKNNAALYIKETGPAQSQAFKQAVEKARLQADGIAQAIGKTLKDVHSVQYVDDKAKILHLWNSLVPVQLYETVETPRGYKYRLALIVNFSFE